MVKDPLVPRALFAAVAMGAVVATTLVPIVPVVTATAQTCTSSVGPGIPPPAEVPSGLQWFHASWYGQSGYPTLCPGETSTATVAYYNSGSEGWYASRLYQAALLGTWDPDPGQDQPSPLGGDGTMGSPATGWPGHNRVAAQPVEYVGPGQVAWFQFTVRAPTTPGVYRLYIRPLIEGTTWMRDEGVYWQVFVKTDDSEQAVVVDTVDPAGDRFGDGSQTFSYDSNDTFRYKGAEVNIAEFELMLSRGDTVAMRYDPEPAGSSTFDIAIDLGHGAPRLWIVGTQGDNHVTIDEPPSNVDGLRYSLQRSSIERHPAAGCNASTGTYLQIASLTIPAGSDQVTHVDADVPRGLYCYRAGTINPVTGTIEFGYSRAQPVGDPIGAP